MSKENKNKGNYIYWEHTYAFQKECFTIFKPQL